jgi:hypothetical protein
VKSAWRTRTLKSFLHIHITLTAAIIKTGMLRDDLIIRLVHPISVSVWAFSIRIVRYAQLRLQDTLGPFRNLRQTGLDGDPNSRTLGN